MKKFFLVIFLLVGCSHQPNQPQITTIIKPSWIQKSDALAAEFSKDLAQIYPEAASEMGYNEFDRKGLLFDSAVEEKTRTLFVIWAEKLKTEITKTDDLELKTDFEVLRSWILNQINLIDTSQKIHEIEFTPALKTIYQNLFTLANSQSSVERKKAAVDRFKVYVYGDATHKPLLLALIEVFENHLKKYQGQSKHLPYRNEVELYIKDSDSYLAGIEELLKTSGRTDWGQDWLEFKKQAHNYAEFVQKTVLVNTRKNPQLPLPAYTQLLQRKEIRRTPLELIQRGQTDYKKLYIEFRKQAKKVAKIHQLKKTDPASVIQYLKSNSVTSPAEVEKLYKQADARLSEIIRTHQLVSLPTSNLKIRIAGDAESKAAPVPHLNAPPLVNNKGERPEFVVPASTSGPSIDDFSSIHSAMILTAHEGRPGHDLQYSSMLDKGVSLIRGTYAANSVNIEGWALYAEDLVYPYLTPEEKLSALQMRLWRIARMFLDPQFQLGLISDQKVMDLFTKELGVSKVMASLEVNRYKFADVGQAPSYYEGYLLVKQMKEDQQKKLGKKFNLKCFNDRLLSFGLLPLRISAERIKTDAPCENE